MNAEEFNNIIKELLVETDFSKERKEKIIAFIENEYNDYKKDKILSCVVLSERDINNLMDSLKSNK